MIGLGFSQRATDDFYSFIDDVRLCDITMGRYSSTRVGSNGANSSKSDRFYYLKRWSISSLMALDLIILDHRPIWLSPINSNYDPNRSSFLIHGYRT